MSMKLVCEVMVNGVATTKVLTTVDTMDQGVLVKTKPGVGKPFLMFSTLPTGQLIAAELNDPIVPIVDVDPAVNNQNIATMKANPQPYLDLLTFAS